MALSDKQKQDLVTVAVGAKEKAHAKYSNFPVGAALLCHDGTVITGKLIVELRVHFIRRDGVPSHVEVAV